MKRPHPGKINRNSSPSVPRATRLVCTLERRHRLALLVIQGLGLDSTEVQVNLAVGVLLPCEGVLHPVLVITLREVLTSVGTTGLLTVGSSNSGLGSVSFSVNQPSFLSQRKNRDTYAQVSKLRSSRVSTMSVFQIMLRSLVPTWSYS